jgi:hypothetical protein
MVESLVKKSSQSETVFRALFAEKTSNQTKSLQRSTSDYLGLPNVMPALQSKTQPVLEWEEDEKVYFYSILKFCYQHIHITDMRNLRKKW